MYIQSTFVGAMKKTSIPVYDICSIDDHTGSRDLLIERFGSYLNKHYSNLHRPHRHSFFHLVLFTKGKGSHTIDFKRYTVKPFQIYFMVPGQVHSWHFDGETDGYIIHFNEALFSNFLSNKHYLTQFSFFSGYSEANVQQVPPAIQTEVLHIFEALLKEVSGKQQQYMDAICLQLLQLFILLERNTSAKKAKPVPQQKFTLLKSFQQLIDRHYRDIKLPKEYAELLYVTPNHLNALCQELLGKTAGELIRERIILEAKRLLTNAGMSVTEIAYDLNFKDNAYFNRVFRNSEGITPDEFRKRFINL